MHKTIEPSILYFGTPVVLISTRNEDGTTNVAPMSSAWFLGWGCMIGLASSSKTSENILREQECVLNLPSVDQVDAVNRLARTTGTHPVPASKLAKGYRYVKDKLGVSGLSELASERVNAARVAECPVQMEAVLQARQLSEDSRRNESTATISKRHGSRHSSSRSSGCMWMRACGLAVRQIMWTRISGSLLS
jgi:flavin reductase (DIM6/NTAB) family NADH-FMN oxidoreductase RutF